MSQLGHLWHKVIFLGNGVGVQLRPLGSMSAPLGLDVGQHCGEMDLDSAASVGMLSGGGQQASCHMCSYRRGSTNSAPEALFPSTIKVLLMLLNHVEISDSAAQPN